MGKVARESNNEVAKDHKELEGKRLGLLKMARGSKRRL